MIDIISASPNHANPLSEFAIRTFYQAYKWYNTAENMKNYVANYFSPDQLKKEISERKSNYFIAVDDEKIVGYVKLTIGNKKEELLHKNQLEIERIYVDRSDYGKGTGYRLLQKTIDFSNENDINVIWLGVWQKNKIAIDFYQRNRFEIFGVHHFILGDDVQDDFLMKLEL